MSSQIFNLENTIMVIAALAAVGLLFVLRKTRKSDKKNMIAQLMIVIFILVGVTLGLVFKGDETIQSGDILLVDLIIVAVYCIFAAVIHLVDGKKGKHSVMTTRKLAFLGIIVGLASVLMLLGFPVMPGFIFLKVEISGVIFFMTLLWFDLKTATLVSLITNFVHVFMPGSPPVILFLDEGINFVATMIFLLPAAFLIDKQHLQEKNCTRRIFWVSLTSVIFTTIFMTLYNAFINLPLVYRMDMGFIEVLEVFGVFNLIKWGVVAVIINLVWRRLYGLRQFNDDYDRDLSVQDDA